jgi:hypothetical protein
MRKKINTGLLIGLIAGILDIIPMIIKGLTWDANLSAFSMWIVVGIFLSLIKIKINGIFKGLIISFLVLLPNLFIIGWKEPFSLVPILIMTFILGSLSGLLYQRIIKE